MAAQPKPRKSRFTVLPASGSRPSVWQREADAEAAEQRARPRSSPRPARGAVLESARRKWWGRTNEEAAVLGAFRALERDRRRADRAAARAKRAAWKRMTPEERRAEKALIHKLGKVGEQDLTRIKEQAKSRRKDDRRVTREDERRKRRLRKKEKYGEAREARARARRAAGEDARQARAGSRPTRRRRRRSSAARGATTSSSLKRPSRGSRTSPATRTSRGPSEPAQCGGPFRKSRRKCWREAVDAAALLKVRKDAADAARDAAVADFRKARRPRAGARAPAARARRTRAPARSRSTCRRRASAPRTTASPRDVFVVGLRPPTPDSRPPTPGDPSARRWPVLREP
ncbi:hypothetical protein SO694_00037263 [Aureococcus anophagefferens]|uniref:Uncharacterized protein n=1 Tax=Aureococcus anophagefferens TaxID=44056 RepID=A0ABR1FL51_AURAN